MWRDTSNERAKVGKKFRACKYVVKKCAFLQKKFATFGKML